MKRAIWVSNKFLIKHALNSGTACKIITEKFPELTFLKESVVGSLSELQMALTSEIKISRKLFKNILLLKKELQITLLLGNTFENSEKIKKYIKSDIKSLENVILILDLEFNK